MKCIDCLYWGNPNGYRSQYMLNSCHRNAPVAGMTAGVWPKTADSDWCGEFKPRASLQQKPAQPKPHKCSICGTPLTPYDDGYLEGWNFACKCHDAAPSPAQPEGK